MAALIEDALWRSIYNPIDRELLAILRGQLPMGSRHYGHTLIIRAHVFAARFFMSWIGKTITIPVGYTFTAPTIYSHSG